ncbi:MAG: TonB family protein [Gammaproteobacteria bacterium]|nr:TonB family protein [Gammaproteobacteria bacterium]MBT8134565.1 TonB family protein [Gammaproteobacteria bacterium]NNJ50926.1 energy transducer TonB [Gammaproteobacteria bacterium]
MTKKRRTIQPKITDNDRFGMTFFLATIFHGMIILGVTFSISPPADSKTAPALDIILVQTKTPDESEKADYLAQVSQKGGGDADQKARPREQFSAPTLSKQPGIAKQTSVQQVKKQKQNEQLALVTQKNSEFVIDTEKTPLKAEDDTTIDKANTSQNTQTARLAAEISHNLEKQASIERTKYLNSSTKAFAPAKYMRQWIDRVERVGNLNYPDQARRQKLSGTLILDVVISADGELLKTDLRQSSGHQILDDAAKRIVRLAAPYSAFPEKLRAETDVIHITRSWEFMNSSGLRTR